MTVKTQQAIWLGGENCKPQIELHFGYEINLDRF